MKLEGFRVLRLLGWVGMLRYDTQVLSMIVASIGYRLVRTSVFRAKPLLMILFSKPFTFTVYMRNPKPETLNPKPHILST